MITLTFRCHAEYNVDLICLTAALDPLPYLGLAILEHDLYRYKEAGT
jgi:hypothetical protein